MSITRSILPLAVCLFATAPTHAADSVTYSEWAKHNAPLGNQLTESQQAASTPALETDPVIDEPGGPGDDAVPSEVTPPKTLEDTETRSMIKDGHSGAPTTETPVANTSTPTTLLFRGLEQAVARTTAALQEAWVTTKIRSELALKQGIDSGRIKVETDDGTVTLAGRVLDECQKQQALVIAGDTRGVEQILDLIQVYDSAPNQTL